MNSWRIGVDSGGTFTDICVFDTSAGTLHVWKVPSTPTDPSKAIGEGIAASLAEFGGHASAVAYLGHGTTVATNALIQGRVARTGLITTSGFRDLLEIGRQKRPSLYDLQCDKPAQIVPRSLRLEVAERLRHDGRVDTPLDEAAVRAAARQFADSDVESVAIAFLYSYVDPRHEQRAREIVAEELPDIFVTCSHEIAPEFREFERFSTAVVNSGLGPVMDRYLGRLAKRIENLGLNAPAHVTQSNGGVISFETARQQPVRTVLSGPSTGVVGATALAALTGTSDLITFDMGGTSSDVALIEGGKAMRSGEHMLHGHPLKIPMLDIHTVGAGGGSIAWIDSGGLLKIGPASAGADPGPACYGLGSRAATVTDANVALGVLPPTSLLNGRMPIERDLAIEAVRHLGDTLNLGWEETAQGILAIVTANMTKAIRVISVQRGYDPRRFAMMAFGGAGPIHAARLARELEISRVLVPPHPGILCATGLLLTDLVTDYARTRLTPLTESDGIIALEFEALEEQARQWFTIEGVLPDAQSMACQIDMRYVGQNYELPVSMPQNLCGAELLNALKIRFEEEHRRLYGYIAADEPIQLVTFRLQATGHVPKSEISTQPPTEKDLDCAQIGVRDVWLPEAGGWTNCPVFARSALGPGHVLNGPAIIEQMDATTLLLPGQRAELDSWMTLSITEIAS